MWIIQGFSFVKIDPSVHLKSVGFTEFQKKKKQITEEYTMEYYSAM